MKYLIYYTQPDRKNGVTVEGICQRSDGKYYVLTMDGNIHSSATPPLSNTFGEVWNFKLTSTGVVEREADGRKRAQAEVFVADDWEIANMPDVGTKAKAVKMGNLIEFWKKHPSVAYYEYEEGGLKQLNPNFNSRRKMGVYFVLINQSTIETYEFSQNRVKRKAMGLLDDAYDKCEKIKDFQGIHDICYGLNVSITPYKTAPKELYNKIENYISRAPESFISFMERAAETKLIVLFKKAYHGVSADKEPLIKYKNEAFYFGQEILGKSQEDVVYFLSKNTKVAEFMEDALMVKRPAAELGIVEKRLKEEIESVVAVGMPQDEEKAKETENELETVQKLQAHATTWANKLNYSKANADKFTALVTSLKEEFDTYKPENKTVFAELFNGLTEKKNINFKLKA